MHLLLDGIHYVDVDKFLHELSILFHLEKHRKMFIHFMQDLDSFRKPRGLILYQDKYYLKISRLELILNTQFLIVFNFHIDTEKFEQLKTSLRTTYQINQDTNIFTTSKGCGAPSKHKPVKFNRQCLSQHTIKIQGRTLNIMRKALVKKVFYAIKFDDVINLVKPENQPILARHLRGFCHDYVSSTVYKGVQYIRISPEYFSHLFQYSEELHEISLKRLIHYLKENDYNEQPLSSILSNPTAN